MKVTKQGCSLGYFASFSPQAFPHIRILSEDCRGCAVPIYDGEWGLRGVIHTPVENGPLFHN